MVPCVLEDLPDLSKKGPESGGDRHRRAKGERRVRASVTRKGTFSIYPSSRRESYVNSLVKRMNSALKDAEL